MDRPSAMMGQKAQRKLPAAWERKPMRGGQPRKPRKLTLDTREIPTRAGTRVDLPARL